MPLKDVAVHNSCVRRLLYKRRRAGWSRPASPPTTRPVDITQEVGRAGGAGRWVETVFEPRCVCRQKPDAIKLSLSDERSFDSLSSFLYGDVRPTDPTGRPPAADHRRRRRGE